MKNYPFKDAKDWMNFLKKGHTKKQILRMKKYDLYYPCWVEELELFNNLDEEWYIKFCQDLFQLKKRLRRS